MHGQPTKVPLATVELTAGDCTKWVNLRAESRCIFRGRFRWNGLFAGFRKAKKAGENLT